MLGSGFLYSAYSTRLVYLTVFQLPEMYWIALLPPNSVLPNLSRMPAHFDEFLSIQSYVATPTIQPHNRTLINNGSSHIAYLLGYRFSQPAIELVNLVAALFLVVQLSTN